MYFDFDDRRPDTPTLDAPMSRREAAMLSVFLHVVALLLIVFVPRIPWVQAALVRAQQAVEQRVAEQMARAEQERARFVFVQPRVDTPALSPPPRVFFSDQDRVARSVERAPNPDNPLPFSQGNTSEFVEAQENARARGQGPADQPGEATPPGREAQRSNGGTMAYLGNRPGTTTAPGTSRAGGGDLGEALRNLDRYVQDRNFDNRSGGGAFGPAIQFDTKGVEFGPWIRRFVAQIKRNWFIPMAAMSMSGHVVITFNVHKDGRITDLTIIGPSSVDAFNNSAFNALLQSNPTQSLPPEYPADKAFFTVTFFYNESPPSPQ